MTSGNVSPESRPGDATLPPRLRARGLTASTSKARIFAPIDLDLYPGQLCMVSGPQGSGKSALLLSLAGRFKAASGELYIDGIDAFAQPYKVLQRTSVATLGDYVQAEDRLTIDESIVERCFIDTFPRRKAEGRIRRMEEALGFRIDRSTELEQLQPLERAVASLALAMIRPASVVIIDDADRMVPHSQQPKLYRALAALARMDGACVIASVVEADYDAPGSVPVTLRSNRADPLEPLSSIHLISSPPASDAATPGPSDAPASETASPKEADR